MTKVLITGANSFVGQNFIKNTSFKEVEEICLKVNRVEDIDFSPYKAILHVAAIVHQTDKISLKKYYRVNTDLAIETAIKAKEQGVKNFIFLSTVKVYGEFKPEFGIWTEESVCNPDDAYGKSKYAAELELQNLSDNTFKVAIIRPPLIYGEGVKANMLNIIKLVDRFPILPLGGISNRRSFTSIENLVQLIDACINQNASGIFLAMDETPLSSTQLTRMIAKHLDKKITLFRLPNLFIAIGKKVMPEVFDRLYGSFEIDNSITRKTLNYKPKVTINDGIEKMVKAYIENERKIKVNQT